MIKTEDCTTSASTKTSDEHLPHSTPHRNHGGRPRVLGFLTLECPTCHKVFTGDASNSGVRSNYRRHLITHTGTRPFVCHLCSADFLTSQNCKRHLRMVHDFEMPSTRDDKHALLFSSRKRQRAVERRTTNPEAVGGVAPLVERDAEELKETPQPPLRPSTSDTVSAAAIGLRLPEAAEETDARRTQRCTAGGGEWLCPLCRGVRLRYRSGLIRHLRETCHLRESAAGWTNEEMAKRSKAAMSCATDGNELSQHGGLEGAQGKEGVGVPASEAVTSPHNSNSSVLPDPEQHRADELDASRHPTGIRTTRKRSTTTKPIPVFPIEPSSLLYVQATSWLFSQQQQRETTRRRRRFRLSVEGAGNATQTPPNGDDSNEEDNDEDETNTILKLYTQSKQHCNEKEEEPEPVSERERVWLSLLRYSAPAATTPLHRSTTSPGSEGTPSDRVSSSPLSSTTPVAALNEEPPPKSRWKDSMTCGIEGCMHLCRSQRWWRTHLRKHHPEYRSILAD